MDREENLIERITLLSLILLILFGVLQYIPSERTYEELGIEVVLKVFSETFFQVALLAVLIYLIIVGLDLMYGDKHPIPEKFKKITYNFIMISSLFSVIAIMFLVLSIRIVMAFPFLISLGSLIIPAGAGILLICFSILFIKYVC